MWKKHKCLVGLPVLGLEKAKPSKPQKMKEGGRHQAQVDCRCRVMYVHTKK